MTTEKNGSAKSIQKEMEKYLGIHSIEELYQDIPSSLLLSQPLDVPGPFSERDLTQHLDKILSKNRTVVSFLGGGIANHYIPALVREVMTKPELLNSYTPYQPEVSQGMLQGLFEYQSLFCELTNMNVINASMYDWATAIGEAILMAVRLAKRRTKVLISKAISPDRLAVVKNYLAGPEIDYELVGYDPTTGEVNLAALQEKLSENIAGFYFENPNYFGVIESQAEEICKLVHQVQARAIVGVDPLSLALIKPPGDYQADIVVGEGQPFGSAMSFGGPILGFIGMNYDRKNIRHMPGRLVGLTTTEDEQQRAFTLTLSTREQHIRREKATSNICTNQSILGFAAGVYLSLLGPEGLKGTAEYCLSAARYLAMKINELTHFEAPALSGTHFKEFTIRLTQGKMKDVENMLIERGFIGGFSLVKSHPELGEATVVCVTEMHSMEDIDNFLSALEEIDKELGG
ncbi:MAG: aminomethyl-transferring glycine dehydrogenase subunit GcvPA [Candidatus Heimdallarchaeota archaeon]|nr:aminomethyl-transferring glycine dehydrogenase subunit GcvPA [Candidatus Heimdallarchaeota archaeon]